MKKLVFCALSALATAAMSAGPAPTSEIRIVGSSTQTASFTGAAVSNTADGNNASAQQNLASNSGDVYIGGTSSQTVTLNGGNVTNRAETDATAQQNLSSNIGEVVLQSGSSTQNTSSTNSYVSNYARGKDAMAVQNIASNNSCFVCEASSGSPHPHTR